MIEASPEADALLRARALELGYGGRTVLAGVDWEVRAGQVWFLVGPNGSGKTTLLRAVLGLLPPRAGVLERDPARAGPARIGFVPQRIEMNPALPTTVREFVSLGLVGLRTTRAERESRLAWALERAGLSGLADADYWSLSGGQRQRASVARALVRRPALLILDEPTEGLDVPTEQAFLATATELHRAEGMTILFVTHRLAVAAQHATHLAIFHRGRLVAGPRERVLADPVLHEAFGAAGAALATGEHADGAP